jgi:hypothetical protein
VHNVLFPCETKNQLLVRNSIGKLSCDGSATMSLRTQNDSELQCLVGVEGPLTLWLCLARISALLLYTVAVAAGQQQCEGDDC